VGSTAARRFAQEGLEVVGIDNDMRGTYFGAEASTAANRALLEAEVKGFVHHEVDVRDRAAIDALFARWGERISVVVHAAAQPSHDWAARDPFVDFSVNATGTLTLLEACRRRCPEASFIFTSTNKVYGARPNELPLVEGATRWEVDPSHPFAAYGIDETMSIDATLHSLFGVSKAASDLMVQEYGRYFGMRTVCFRAGCLTGPAHAGVELHGFLSYLVRCAASGRPYVIYGYKGKQVRDNIHSSDLVEAFWHFVQRPRSAAVYNIGGGRAGSCSVLEAIDMIETEVGAPLRVSLADENRVGDHVWWVSDVRRFEHDYPGWTRRYDLAAIVKELVDALSGPARLALQAGL